MTQLRACHGNRLRIFKRYEGHIVLLGIKDNGDIVGADVTDKTQASISHEIQKIEPSPNLEVHYIPLGKKKVVVITLSRTQWTLCLRGASIYT